MNNPTIPTSSTRVTWLRYIIIILVVEKIFQHVIVTLAFYFNWGEIDLTVAVNPDILLVLGTVVAVLFALSLWGLITQKKWAVNLVISLALFDIFGEFVAQGTVMIAIPVSFLVAILLLILALFYRRLAVK